MTDAVNFEVLGDREALKLFDEVLETLAVTGGSASVISTDER